MCALIFSETLRIAETQIKVYYKIHIQSFMTYLLEIKTILKYNYVTFVVKILHQCFIAD
jgi:hypothetical protein